MRVSSSSWPKGFGKETEIHCVQCSRCHCSYSCKKKNKTRGSAFHSIGNAGLAVPSRSITGKCAVKCFFINLTCLNYGFLPKFPSPPPREGGLWRSSLLWALWCTTEIKSARESCEHEVIFVRIQEKQKMPFSHLV